MSELDEYLKRLKENDIYLTKLNLFGRQADVQGVKSLVEVLKINHTLTYLILGGNQIGDEGAKYIGEALKVNHT